LDFLDGIFIKASNINFRGNPSRGSHAGACGTVEMNITGPFSYYANAHTTEYFLL
jgi:hypothetical protein